MDIRYAIDKVRINLLPGNSLINIIGWTLTEDTVEVPGLILKVNGKRTEFESAWRPRPDVFIALETERKTKAMKAKKPYVEREGTEENLNNGFVVSVRHYPDPVKSIELIASLHGTTRTLLKMKDKQIVRKATHTGVMCTADEADFNDKMGLYTLTGSAFSVDNEPVSFRVKDENGKYVKFFQDAIKRRDFINDLMLDEEKSVGFKISFNGEVNKKYTVVAYTDSSEEIIDVQKVLHANDLANRMRNTLGRIFDKQNIHSAIRYMKKYGFSRTLQRASFYLNSSAYYDKWFKEQRVTEDELEKQKQVKFDYEPKISLVVPVFNTPIEYLDEMISTVVNQSYSNWELCIADGSDETHPAHKAVGVYAKKDPRIKVMYLDQNYGISGNTNKALEMATGDYIALYDHDDFLELDALYEVVKGINEHHAEIVYTDEDKFSMKTKHFEFPHFKTDYAPDLLCSHNYITHLFVVKAEIMKEVGGFRTKYDGSQDYDMILRCIELSSPEKIYHLPKVVYHWRMHANSTAADPESKLYCYEAGERAIQDHLKRVGYEATVKMYKPFYGYYHVYYTIKDNPLVSVIIPNKDGKGTLKRCIDSLFNVNEYKNIEVIVVENNSTTSEIFDYYKEVQAAHDNVRVVTWPGKTFNYSAINNFGVKEAKGEYLLFLNNDTEMIARDSITELVGHCQLPYTGAAGAKLLYEDDTVQHAGVIIGLGGIANNAFQHIGKMEPGYMQRPLVCANYSAVTGACMMVKKELFEKVNGFDEDLAVAYNDVDLCLKLRQLGLYNVCDAFSLWHHYESISRGYEDTPQKKARLEKESEIFRNKWPEIFAKGDPYYSPNFSTDKGFELRKLSGAAKK